MSIFSREVATIPGILDSDAFAGGEEQYNAKILRELVRTGNWMSSADSTILIDCWDMVEDNLSLALDSDRVLYAYAEVPTRPIHNSAIIRLRARVEDGAEVIWTFQMGNRSRRITQLGTGLVETVETKMDIDSASRQTFIISVRSGTPLTASSSVIGTPVTWTSGTSTYIESTSLISVGFAAWTFLALNTQDYVLEISDSVGGIIAVKQILQAISGSRFNHQALVINPLSEAELINIINFPTAYGNQVPDGITFNIRIARPEFNAESIIVRGTL